VHKDKKDLLIDALKSSDINGFHYYKVKGQGELTSDETEESLKSYCFEIYSSTASVDRIKKLIIQSVQTGNIGDGFIAISPVEEVIRIRDCSGNSFKETQNL
jgi:nitrogen regulatory protein PII